MVKAFGMLGNSSWGITAMQKRLLYQTCVVPVLTYGLCLWHFKGAKVQGVLKSLAKVQRTAALWITGCFRTSPTGGVESLAGLLPMHLLLRRLVEQSCLRAATLSQSHPLCPLMGGSLRGMAPAHQLGLTPSGPVSAPSLHSPLVDAAKAALSVSPDKIEAFGPKSRLGHRVTDLYSDRMSLRRPPLLEEDDVAQYVKDLDAAHATTKADATCMVIASDASIPCDTTFRVAVAALVYSGGAQVN